jgi:membrane protein DedA with SNARE-associated domain
MTNWAAGLVASAGYSGIVLLMFLENVFPPIPSELIMPLAGYTVSQGTLTLVGVTLAGMLGSVLGALTLYYAGRKLGQERLCRAADRHGRWLAMSRGDILRARSWLDRHGALAVLAGRLVPGIRSLVSIPAGVARMNLALFLLCTCVGTAAWAGLLAYLGFVLGSRFSRVADVLDPLSAAVLIGVAAIYLWRVVRFRRPPVRE